MTLSRSQAKKITAAALSQARLGDVRVELRASTTGNLRFGDSMPTTSGEVEEIEVAVTAQTKEGRHATARGNRTDPDGLAALVQQAEQMAELVPVDPEHMPPLGKTTYLRVNALDRKVARMGAQERAEAVGAAIEAGKKQSTDVAGLLLHRDEARVYADRAGLFGYHRETSVSMTTTCRTGDGTGSAKRGFASHALGGLDAGTLAAEAASWAVRSKEPTGLDPGRYTVVLMPDAVADLMGFFVGALSHRRASEGRSFFSEPGGGTKLGQSLFGKDISVWSDPGDAEHPSSPVGSGGVPRQKVQWIDAGKLQALSAGRWWAEQAGVPVRERPASLFMAGGTADLDALVAGVDRGVLVSRFWYNRSLDPRQMLATGLTRDGTFLIEKGKITTPIKNFRYNDSPATLMRNVVAMGVPRRAGLSGYRVSVVPTMVVEGFNFESVSDAI